MCVLLYGKSKYIYFEIKHFQFPAFPLVSVETSYKHLRDQCLSKILQQIFFLNIKFIFFKVVQSEH